MAYKAPSEVLRNTIVRSGYNCAELEALSGVSDASINKFVNGKSRLNLESFDSLCRVFRLKLVQRSEMETVK